MKTFLVFTKFWAKNRTDSEWKNFTFRLHYFQIFWPPFSKILRTLLALLIRKQSAFFNLATLRTCQFWSQTRNQLFFDLKPNNTPNNLCRSNCYQKVGCSNVASRVKVVSWAGLFGSGSSRVRAGFGPKVDKNCGLNLQV